MMKKVSVWVACCCLFFFIETSAQNKLLNSPMRKLQLAEFAISKLYVDSVNESDLVEHAIIGMLKELDPHSTYSTPEEVKKINEPLQGKFDGVGIQFNMVKDTLFVIQPISGGPAEKAGILPGDRIVAINDTIVAGVQMGTDEIMYRLRGKRGTKVQVDVLRKDIKELLPITIKRDRIPVVSLDAHYMVNDSIGYIRINRFSLTTSKEFLTALKDLQQQGMQALILDLQGNGGGYLNAAIEIAEQFLNRDQLIVYTIGRKNPRTDFQAKGKGLLKEGKLIILIDEYSASASEIVTGALQDWDRAMVVGRRSFGKGLVQRPINLPDGSMIRLTVARYYTPAGRCIQKPYGIETPYEEDLANRYNRGEMLHADSIHFPDSLKYYTLKKKRPVYGGGGIMPDYFVPIDTTLHSGYYSRLRDRGALIQWNIKQIEESREKWLDMYTNFSDFATQFGITPAMLDELKEIGTTLNIPFDEKQYQKSLPLIRIQLKALLARDLWGMNEYFQIANQLNTSMQKAIELLK